MLCKNYSHLHEKCYKTKYIFNFAKKTVEKYKMEI